MDNVSRPRFFTPSCTKSCRNLVGHVRAGLVLACLLLTTSTASFALAQDASSEPAADAPTAPLVCGVVDEDPARAAYFRDLCRAVAVAVHGSAEALDAQTRSAADIAQALAGHEVPVAFGLPFELRADMSVAFGPVVLVEAGSRYALASAPGEQAAGDRAAWLFFALVQAEAWGVDRENVRGGLEDPARATFAAYRERVTAQLGLDDDALTRMIETVGNHGEIYGRHFEDDPGPNRPVELGGQLYAPPASDR